MSRGRAAGLCPCGRPRQACPDRCHGRAGYDLLSKKESRRSVAPPAGCAALAATGILAAATAAAVIVVVAMVAAAATIVIATVVPAAAAAQQDDQQNDPPAAIPRTIITPTHEHSPHFNWRGHNLFPAPSEPFYDRRLSPVPGM